jgi:hypothetical protein
MAAYRYLVFPKHQQPTADEAAQLHGFAPLFKNHIAIGSERKSGALAILFEQEAFEQAMTSSDGFEMLIRKWQVHGCELVEKLKFVKDPAALKPTHSQLQQRHLSQEKILVAKQNLAQQAIAKSLLHVQHTIEHYSLLQRIGKAVPYALIAFGTIGIIAAGFYVSHRMQNSGREQRKETIERVSTGAMDEPLEAQSKAEVPQ